MPKAIWDFNGTERPGAVCLAAASAAHTQKGLPAFTICGRDVQNIADTLIPADVRGEIPGCVKTGLAVVSLRGKSYLSIGGVSMGIAGSNNVNEENIFRPRVWTALGTKALEGADFRACASFGPHYGKNRR